MVFCYYLISYIVSVSMVVRYPPNYPDEAPNVCFVDADNISEDDIIDLTQMIYVELIFCYRHLGKSTGVYRNGNGL